MLYIPEKEDLGIIIESGGHGGNVAAAGDNAMDGGARASGRTAMACISGMPPS
jgi:hypothetical protein